jgi:hypothetical protein
MASTPRKLRGSNPLAANELQFTPRMKCPHCGNDLEFFEISEEAVVVTHYIQNPDGSFSIEDTSVQSIGDSRLFCGSCEEDLSELHERFSDMIF